MANAYRTINILFEVLQFVSISEGVANVPQEILDVRQDIQKRRQMFAPFNILPLDLVGETQAIMQLDEVRSSLQALQNIRGLPEPHSEKPWQRQKKKDILHWLEAVFGFQKASVMNQREHLILLLANVQTRLDTELEPSDKLNVAIDAVMKMMFQNYIDWCGFLGIHSNLRLPEIHNECQQRKIIYIGLYLLIWGEAANLKFMPECLCYIFHQMAKEVIGMLSEDLRYMTGQSMRSAYGGAEESFLQGVVKPIYDVIKQEASFGTIGNASHSSWRNYDDLNEYFWSVECFSLSWPLRTDHKFFLVPPIHQGNSSILKASSRQNIQDRRLWRKTGFVEIRSFWHLFRSFDRMWTFFILSFQVMLVVAWSGDGSIFLVFDGDVFHKVLSVFITAAALGLLQGVLDIIFILKASHSLSYSDIIRLFLKPLVAVAWVIILGVFYVQSWKRSDGAITLGGKRPSSYVLAIIAYSLSNVLGLILSTLPMLQSWMEKSNAYMVRLMLWWFQPRLYVGRAMQESWTALILYTLFWALILMCKLFFSYYVEIKPLVGPTKRIMALKNKSYQWHELFPHDKKNIGAVMSLWAPVTLVYFMDAQIWYSVFSTLVGGIVGASLRLGEIRNVAMLMSRFGKLPKFVFEKLVPRGKSSKEEISSDEQSPDGRELKAGSMEAIIFSQYWNKFITNLREEDVISNREMELMLVTSNSNIKTFQWPLFLLTNKLYMAIQITAKLSSKKNKFKELQRRIEADMYMDSVVRECYETFKYALKKIILGEVEKRIVSALIAEVEENITQGTLLLNFQLSLLPAFCEQFLELISLLIEPKVEIREDVSTRAQMILAVQGMFELVVCEMLEDKVRKRLESSHGPLSRSQSPDYHNTEYFAAIEPKPAILFPPPPPNEDGWFEQLRRIQLLLQRKESTEDIPKNTEALIRLSFFSNSLYMDMPAAPHVHNMCSFSVLTPYHNEAIIYRKDQLQIQNEDGISILFYLQKIYPDEWENFLERKSLISEDEAWDKQENGLCDWASYCTQTLSRTVRGMMYYKTALQLQAFQALAPPEDLKKGYKRARNDVISQRKHYWEKVDAIVDLKFTYIVACQDYGAQKKTGDFHAKEILHLMKSFPSLRVAYIDENEGIYYSILVKGIDDHEQEIYKIKLPGPPIIGEGKSENQNHAIIFTRGEALQTIDMNQDNYFEEAIKMRNFLEEFNRKSSRRAPSILGLREHIFTGSVSSLAWFKSTQESTFVTIGQRVLTHPLRIRFYYGHPDVFDRLFHITRGGVSKASKDINLSEELFAGFNSKLRCGNISHHEYIQVGKGRSVGFNQIAYFDAKVADGNAEQALSRDIYRLGQHFDFFRTFSLYFTTIGPYFNSMLVVLTIFIFLYGQLYLVLSGLESVIIKQDGKGSYSALQAALASQTFVQLGLVSTLPIIMEIGLERGFSSAFKDFVVMQLQLASMFFTFSLGTKAHCFCRTILHGSVIYRRLLDKRTLFAESNRLYLSKPFDLMEPFRASHRGLVVRHETFAENYRLYSRSHFIKGFELVILLIVYDIYGSSPKRHLPYLFITFAMWFLAGTWLVAPFLFNPSCFEWPRVVDDWQDWKIWMNTKAHIGTIPNKSWESWWEEQQDHLKYTGHGGRMWEIILSIRFFLYQYGLVYHLQITRHTKSLYVYVISWLVIVGLLMIAAMIVKVYNVMRKRIDSNHNNFRILSGVLNACSIGGILALFIFAGLTIGDAFICILAFMPTGWAILQLAQVVRPLVEKLGLWKHIQSIARFYDYSMGFVLFMPIAILAYLPFVSEYQTQLLFNQAFSRGLEISRILGNRKRKFAHD